MMSLRVANIFTNSPQYKNVNIANFVLAVLLEINYAMNSATLKCNSLVPTDI